MPRDNEEDLIARVLKGNAEAIDFCNAFFKSIQLLDDFCDQDAGAGRAEAEELTWLVLYRVAFHPFLHRHYAYLLPLVRASVIDWIDANKLEKMGSHEKTLAFVLRDTVSSILIHVAGIIGGDEWMMQVSLEIRQHIYEDTLEEYLKGLEKQP